MTHKLQKSQMLQTYSTSRASPSIDNHEIYKFYAPIVSTKTSDVSAWTWTWTWTQVLVNNIVGCILYTHLTLAGTQLIYSVYNRASICEGGLRSRNSVRTSVRLSVCLSHACIVTKLNDACTADILIPHERAITLLFDTKSGWSAMPPSL